MISYKIDQRVGFSYYSQGKCLCSKPTYTLKAGEKLTYFLTIITPEPEPIEEFKLCINQ